MSGDPMRNVRRNETTEHPTDERTRPRDEILIMLPEA
jgi:hypothetical protein